MASNRFMIHPNFQWQRLHALRATTIGLIDFWKYTMFLSLSFSLGFRHVLFHSVAHRLCNCISSPVVYVYVKRILVILFYFVYSFFIMSFYVTAFVHIKASENNNDTSITCNISCRCESDILYLIIIEFPYYEYRLRSGIHVNLNFPGINVKGTILADKCETSITYSRQYNNEEIKNYKHIKWFNNLENIHISTSKWPLQ